MSATVVSFPPSGGYIQAVRASSAALRESSGVAISQEGIQRFVNSPAFSSTFARLSQNHGLALPLSFSSQLSELNLICILALINFGSGYRVPLHAHTGRGAWDSIRALVFSMFITSADDSDLLSARGIATVTIDKVASLMQVPLHIEQPHATIPGVVIGKLGGPLYELAKTITSTLNETGEILLSQGYPDLGSFVLEALKEGERVGQKPGNVDIETVLEKIILAIPAFRDMALVNGRPVYIFKKALFLLHGISQRFSSRGTAKPGSPSERAIPVPDTSNLPVFSDNVLPSILIHLGIIDVSRANSPSLVTAFKASDNIHALLHPDPALSADEFRIQKNELPKDGPTLTEAEAYVLRASAIDACEQIVEEAHKAIGPDDGWLRNMTTTELDCWLWAGAKDRVDYRKLERFVLRDTVFF